MPVSVSAQADDQYIDIPAGRIAYRSFGSGDDVPLILFSRFRGTMDHWDPALLDVLARERPIVIFDSAGVSQSSGEPADSVTGMAQVAAGFVAALGYEQVDVLGWSLGGTVAQRLTLDEPRLVRRMVLAGTGPGPVPDSPSAAEKVWQVAAKPENNDEDFLYLFFTNTENGRRSGLESLRRLDPRLETSKSVVAMETVKAQFAALSGWMAGKDSAVQHLSDITVPTLVVNGVHDVMVHAYSSYVLSQRLPNAQLILYPDSGHAFLFQHAELFGSHVLEFLR